MPDTPTASDSSPAAAPATKPIRTIHVGVATRALAHLRPMAADPRWRPVAGVDVAPAYMESATREFGFPCFKTLGEALRHADADAVIVVSPVVFHGEQIEEALEAGKHVMVEKPFALELRQAERLVAKAEARGLKIMVTQNARYLPPNHTMRRLVRERAYGAPGYFDLVFHKARPQPYNLSPHQQLWQMSVHDLDMVRSVIPGRPRRVYCREVSPPWTKYPTAPAVLALIEFEGGVEGTYLSSSDSKSRDFQFRVECADAGLYQRGYNGELFVARGSEHTKLPLDPLPCGVGGDHDRLMARLFYEYLAHDAEPDLSGRNNLGTMRLLDACLRSLEGGGPVEIGGD